MRNIATTRILHLSDPAAALDPAKPWIWPLPRLDGVSPSIIPTHDPTWTDGIVQLGYADRAASADFVPIFAAHDGIITYAFRGERGATLCLDHPAFWSSQYDGLESVIALSTDRFRRRRKVRVRTGEVLGHVRAPLRVGFALSRLVDGAWVPVQTAELIHAWPMLPWFAEPKAASAAIAV